MAGMAIVTDLLKKSCSGMHSLHPYSKFSAAVALSATSTAAIAASKPFAYRAFFGDGDSWPRLAYCDAAAILPAQDYLAKLGSISENILKDEAPPYIKKYDIDMKPLWSAFRPRQLTLVTLRSFLLYFLPLLEPKRNEEEDDDDFLPENQEVKKVDLVTPFKRSVIQIIRETTAVTTRRVLERLTAYYLSQRMAWKLLKDAPRSAMRKAQRGIPTYEYVFRVGRTTFRAYVLAIASQWIIDVGTEIFRFLRSIIKPDLDAEPLETRDKAKHLGKKVVGVTLKGTASWICATVGAAIFATIFRPSIGQWIGCIIGDITGPILLIITLDRFNLEF